MWKADLEKERCVLTMFCIQKKVVQIPCVNHFVLETWTYLLLCSPLENSGSNPLSNMILSGQITCNSTKHKSRPGRTSPHLGQTTLSKPFLPPMTPPQDQMAYPMLHGDFTLVFPRMLWLHTLMTSADQLSLPRVQFRHRSQKPKWVPLLIISVH